MRNVADLPISTDFIVLKMLNLKVYLTNTPANVMKVGQGKIVKSGLVLALSFALFVHQLLTVSSVLME